MSKVITVDELRAHLDEHLAEVVRGETLTLIDDGHSVATIAPSEQPVRILRHEPALRLQDFEPGPRPKRLDTNPVGSRLRDFKPSPRPKELVTDALDLVNEDRDSEWVKNGL